MPVTVTLTDGELEELETKARMLVPLPEGRPYSVGELVALRARVEAALRRDMVEIKRLRRGLELAAGMKTIKGARAIVADTLASDQGVRHAGDQ